MAMTLWEEDQRLISIDHCSSWPSRIWTYFSLASNLSQSISLFVPICFLDCAARQSIDHILHLSTFSCFQHRPCSRPPSCDLICTAMRFVRQDPEPSRISEKSHRPTNQGSCRRSRPIFSSLLGKYHHLLSNSFFLIFFNYGPHIFNRIKIRWIWRPPWDDNSSLRYPFYCLRTRVTSGSILHEGPFILALFHITNHEYSTFSQNVFVFFWVDRHGIFHQRRTKSMPYCSPNHNTRNIFLFFNKTCVVPNTSFNSSPTVVWSFFEPRLIRKDDIVKLRLVVENPITKL